MARPAAWRVHLRRVRDARSRAAGGASTRRLGGPDRCGSGTRAPSAAWSASWPELVERHPLRERLRGERTLALYRCGRQAGALRVYQEFSSGTIRAVAEPSPGLRELESAIHARDASVEAPQRSQPAAQQAVGGPGSRRPALLRRRRLAVGGAAAIAIAIAIAVGLASAGGGSARLSMIAVDSVGAISPTQGAISAQVRVGSSPSGVAAGEGAVWVASYSSTCRGSIRRRTRLCKRSRPDRRRAG